MRRHPSAPSRILTTVLFTDIVGSTERAAELGDARWRHLQDAHHRLVRRILKRFRGREIDTAGDGFFATFDSPAHAVRCATALAREVRSLGLEIRAGIHLGEVERSGDNLGGIAVHIGARVAGLAGPGEVLVTSTVKDGVTGSDLRFYPWGTKTLKGVPGDWPLFRVEPAAEPPPAENPVDDQSRDGDRPPSGRRRPALLIGLGLTVALVAGLIVLRPGRGSAPPGTPTTGGGAGGLPLADGNAIARIDPSTGKVTRFVTVSTPGRVAVGEAGIWATAFSATQVVHIDPATARIVGSLRIVAGLSSQLPIIAVAEHAVWICNREQGLLLKVDPATNEVYKQVEISPEPTADGAQSYANAVVGGYGSIWVLNQVGSVARVDPVRNRVTQLITVPFTPFGIAAGEDAIWVGDALEESVTRIDPRTGKRTGTFPVHAPTGLLAAGENGVWVLDTRDGVVNHLDPRSGEASNPIAVGHKPLGITVGGGFVWVSNSADGSISRIDPVTDQVTTIPIGGFPVEVAFGDGAVWVAVQAHFTP